MDTLSGLNGDHRAYQELLGAYALGAVSPDEARALASHVAACPACRAELARLSAAAMALPLTIEERDPPPISRYRLEARVLNDLAQSGQAPPPPGHPEPAGPAPLLHPVPTAYPTWPARIEPARPPRRTQSGLPGDLGDLGQPVFPAWPVWSGDPAPPAAPHPPVGQSPAPPSRSRWMPLAWLGAAAVLAVVAAGLLIWNLDLRRDLDNRQPAETAETVALQAAQSVAGARATMMYLDDAGVMVIALHGAPPPPENEVYQLWLVHDSVVIPFGIFDPTTATCAVTLPDPASYQEVVITREPAPFGSPSAVGPTIFVAPLGAA